MGWRREVSKLGALIRRRKPVDDLAEEIRSHLAMEERENRESGMSPEEAHYAALRKFGNVTRVKEDAWEVWSFVWLEQLWQDIRFGLRMLPKNPGFTTVAVLTLALGIGGNTAIFSLVDAVFLEPLPYSHPEQIVQVMEKTPGGERKWTSTLTFLDWKNQNTVFQAMAAEWWDSMALTGGDVPAVLASLWVSAPYFSIFHARPLLGRTFAPDEDQPGKEHVVVLSHRVWQNRFGGNPGIIGRSIRLNGESYTVIGVMPSKPFDQMWEEVWLPLAFEPKEMKRDYTWLMVWARMKPGVTLEQAQQEMKVIGARISHDHTQWHKGWSVTVDRVRRTAGRRQHAEILDRALCDGRCSAADVLREPGQFAARARGRA